MRNVVSYIRRLRKMIVPLATVALVSVLAFASFRYATHAKLQNTFDQLRRESFPTTLAEFDTFYKHIPDNENGIVTLLDAPALKPDENYFDVSGEVATPDFENMTEDELAQWDKKFEEDNPEWARERDVEEALAKEYGGHENIPIHELIELHDKSTEEVKEEPTCIDSEIELSTDPLPTELHDELMAFFNARQDSLDLIIKASNQPNWRSPVDFTQWPQSVNTDHQVAARDACKWLTRRATLAASDADPESATADLLAALRIAKALTAEPTAMGQLVAFSCTKHTNDALEHVMNRCELSSAQLVALDDAFAQIESPKPMITALGGECALTRGGFRAEKPSLEDFSLFGAGRDFWRKNAGLRYVYNTLNLGAVDNLHFLTTVRSIMKCCETANAKNFQTLTSIGDATYRPALYDLNGSGAIGSMHMVATAYYMQLTRTRVVRTAIAVQRHRQEKGRLPGKLEDLTPDYLNALPTDPATDVKLVFEANDTGFAVRQDADALQNALHEKPLQTVVFRMLR